jgi:peptide chain release factor subunit 1
MRKNSVELECSECNHTWKVSLSRTDELPKCPECKGKDIKEINSISLIDELSTLAGKGNSNVSFVSTDTEEGSQLLQGFGGLAAILRYPVM